MAHHTGRVGTAVQLSDGEFAGRSLGYVWDTILLDYVVATPAAAGGGIAAAVTIIDGGDIAQGAKADLEAAAGNGSVIAILKRLRTLLSGAIAVTGTFWQAVQPVSGTFWQATQPVSGPLTDAQLRAAVVPVDVSDRPARTLGVIASIAAAVDISDRVGRLLGVIANLPAALTGGGNLKVSIQEDGGAVIGIDDNSGSLTVDAPVGTPLFARLSDGAAALIAQKVMALSLPVTIASDQSAVPVTAPALTKGTQGANGFSSQDLKDAGRVQFSCATVIAGVAGVAAEALLTMVPVRDGVAAATAVSQAVTAAKRLRLTHLIIGFVSTAAAVVSVRAGLRINPAGAAVVGSPLIFPIPMPSAAALAQQGGMAVIPLPDGFEFSGAHQFALSHLGSVATYTLWAALVGFEY